MIRRRNCDAAFAAEWDAALTLAHAQLNTARPAENPEREPCIVRSASGRLQLQRDRPMFGGWRIGDWKGK